MDIKNPLFSFASAKHTDVLQVLLNLNMFVLSNMIARDMWQNPQSTLMKTLKTNIRDQQLSDEAREIANAVIEAIEIGVKSFLESEGETPSQEPTKNLLN